MKYRVFKDEDYTATGTVTGSLKNLVGLQAKPLIFEHTHMVSFANIADEQLDYFDNYCITFLLYASQTEAGLATREEQERARCKSTRVCIRAEKIVEFIMFIVELTL